MTALAATSPGGFSSFQNAAINASGKVVFEANLVDGSRGIFTVSGASFEKIVDSNAHPEIDSLNDPMINDPGMVADVAFVLPFDAPEAFTARNGGFTPRNDPASAPFLNTDHPSLNNSGAIAFAAIPSNLRFVAKHQLKLIPFLGWYMWMTGMVFVDRSKRAQAVASLDRAIIQYRAQLDKAAKLARRRRAAFDEPTPGEARLPSGNHGLQRIGNYIEDVSEVVELEIPGLHAEETIF